jgi:sugar diacid utilization regulator
MALASLLNNRYVATETIARNLFPPDPAKHYVLAVTESMPEKNIHQLPPSILNIISLKIPEGRMVFYQDRIVMLFQCHKLEEIDLEKYEGLFKEYYIRCGVSNPFEHLDDIHKAYEEALSALRCSVFFSPKGHVYRYFPLFHIFDLVHQDKELRRFVHSGITKLLNYDAQYQTKWFCNLVVFLFSGCDIQRAAGIFQVHKNTMHYRINKIEEISGCSMKDDSLVFSLKLSIFILYYLEKDSFYNKYGIPRNLQIFPKSL